MRRAVDARAMRRRWHRAMATMGTSRYDARWDARRARSGRARPGDWDSVTTDRWGVLCMTHGARVRVVAVVGGADAREVRGIVVSRRIHASGGVDRFSEDFFESRD